MKILFVLPYVPSLIRVRPYNFIRELSRRHEVTVLATDTPRGSAAAESLRDFCRDVVVVPLKLPAALWGCARGAARGEPLQAAFCRSSALESRLRDLLAEQRFDLVHVEHLRVAYLGDLVPSGIPTVFDSVDCISLLQQRTLASSHSLRQRALAALELGRTRAYEARLIRRFDRVVVTSAEDAGALMSLAPGTGVVVVPNGVDLDYFRPLEGEREPATLVFSGKMSYHANVTALFHFVRNIFPSIRRSHPEVRLRVIGSSPPAAVRALARDPAISVTGYLPDLRPALGRATLAICPVTIKVGIQNKLLEAMAMGLPVVCTREGAGGLSVRDGRDLLVADGPAEFAGQVCRLLGSPRLRCWLGQSGRRYVETHHRWPAVVRTLEGVYVGAVEGKSRNLAEATPANSVGIVRREVKARSR